MVVFGNCIFYEKTGSSEKKNQNVTPLSYEN